MVNHYYFYGIDEDFGPFFLKFCTYFPYNAKLCINGHEYVKRQLAKEGIQGLRTRISRLGTLGKLGLPLLYSQAGQQSNAFCSIDRQDYTTSSGTFAP